MPQNAQKENRIVNEKTKKTVQKVVWTVVIIACIVIVLLMIPHMEPMKISKDNEAPVIEGVKETVIIYEDDDEKAAKATILDGVEAVDNLDTGSQAPNIFYTVYDEKGADVSFPYPVGSYRIIYGCQDRNKNQAERIETKLVVRPTDNEPPVIEGAQDMTVAKGGSVFYRTGVTVTDNSGDEIELKVDSSQVNLNEVGEYPVTYSATDARGNTTSATIKVTVIDTVTLPEGVGDVQDNGTPQDTANVTEAEMYAVADKILGKIITNNMSQYQKAKAIYNYVHTHIKYVGTSDKSSWVNGAYVGFTRGRGDCFNYFACSKALLTRAGIPNVDLQRVGGTTRHYWNLVNTGNGYYHFDTCPHPTGYPLYSFMLTEQQVRDYTQLVSKVRKNYFVYDYDSCPVTVVGTPSGDTPSHTTAPAESQQPSPSPSPSETVQPMPTVTPAPSESPAPAESQAPAETESHAPAESEMPAPTETAQATEE